MKSKSGTGKLEVKIQRSEDSPKYGALRKGKTMPMDKEDAKIMESRGLVEIINPKPKEKDGGE